VALHDVDGEAPSIVNASVTRTRNYLTAAEVETLMAAARRLTRYGHRDATMILIAYRHGLRASELCDLQWHQVELNVGRLHVRRRKRGTPSVHPMQGDEIRALRRLQREQGSRPHVFASERGGPMSPKSFGTLFARLGEHAPGSRLARTRTSWLPRTQPSWRRASAGGYCSAATSYRVPLIRTRAAIGAIRGT